MSQEVENVIDHVQINISNISRSVVFYSFADPETQLHSSLIITDETLPKTA